MRQTAACSSNLWTKLLSLRLHAGPGWRHAERRSDAHLRHARLGALHASQPARRGARRPNCKIPLYRPRASAPGALDSLAHLLLLLPNMDPLPGALRCVSRRFGCHLLNRAPTTCATPYVLLALTASAPPLVLMHHAEERPRFSGRGSCYHVLRFTALALHRSWRCLVVRGADWRALLLYLAVAQIPCPADSCADGRQRMGTRSC